MVLAAVVGLAAHVGLRHASPAGAISARADVAADASLAAHAARARFAEIESLRLGRTDAMDPGAVGVAERVELLAHDLAMLRTRAATDAAEAAIARADHLFRQWRDGLGRAEADLDSLAERLGGQLQAIVTQIAQAGTGVEGAADARPPAVREGHAIVLSVGIALAVLVAWLIGRGMLAPGGAASGTPRDQTPAPLEAAPRGPAFARLHEAIDSALDGIIVLDRDGRIAMANRQVARLLPAASDILVVGTPVEKLARLTGLDPETEQQSLETADGRWLRVALSPIPEGGKLILLADITPLRRQQVALEQANRRFDAALNNMSQGLCLYDAEHRLLVANRRFYEIYRLDPQVVGPGITFRDLLLKSVAAGNHAPAVAEAMIAERLGFVARGEPGTAFQNLADGRVIAISHEPIPGGHWVVTYEDITERRRAEAQITWLARHDGLTGLANRLQLRERLEQALAQCAPGTKLALFGLDLDGFRAVNEALGQAAGDQVLRLAAERLRACAREGDTVARIGADEFAVVQGGTESVETAALFARRLIATLSKPFQVEGQTIRLGASVGIALAPEDGSTHHQLLHHVQLALELCRREQRGSFRFFTPEMDAAVQRRRALEADLRSALDREEFEPAYQPIVDIATGRVSGFEALLRWRHARRGKVSPVEFVPVLEEMGLIVPIGAWMLRRACADAVTWPDGIRVAVNVSAIQFGDPNLVPTVATALADSGLPASRLEIEITESLLLQDEQRTEATLHRLRGLGVRIAMDDFGTGYSSLGYLRRFPFDKLKIDQSFIRDLDRRPDSQAIVRAIIGLGRSLGIRTTAEGVESRAILDILRAEGCAEAQGYLFSKPCAAAKVPDVLRALAQRRVPANAAA